MFVVPPSKSPTWFAVQYYDHPYSTGLKHYGISIFLIHLCWLKIRWVDFISYVANPCPRRICTRWSSKLYWKLYDSWWIPDSHMTIIVGIILWAGSTRTSMDTLQTGWDVVFLILNPEITSDAMNAAQVLAINMKLPIRDALVINNLAVFQGPVTISEGLVQFCCEILSTMAFSGQPVIIGTIPSFGDNSGQIIERRRR